MREVLRKALTKLPPQYQTIFLLKEIRKLKTPEVARRLQIRCGNVRLQLHRARRILRNTIGENFSVPAQRKVDERQPELPIHAGLPVISRIVCRQRERV